MRIEGRKFPPCQYIVLGNFLNCFFPVTSRCKYCSVSLSTVAGLHEHLFAPSFGLHLALNCIPIEWLAWKLIIFVDWTLQIVKFFSSEESLVKKSHSAGSLIWNSLSRVWWLYSAKRSSNGCSAVLLTVVQYPLAWTSTMVPLKSKGSRRRKTPESYLDSCSAMIISNRVALCSLSPNVCTIRVKDAIAR